MHQLVMFKNKRKTAVGELCLFIYNLWIIYKEDLFFKRFLVYTIVNTIHFIDFIIYKKLLMIHKNYPQVA